MQVPVIDTHIKAIYAATTLASGVCDDPIRRSWIRCINDHRLDPARGVEPVVLEMHRLREHQDPIEDFLAVARTGMEQLYKRVADIGYMVLLTDAHGVVVDFIGNDASTSDLKRCGLFLGADWSEARVGTSAAGACMIERVPITCHREDHFSASYISLTCSSAPLFDPIGNFLGVLNLSALTSPAPRESQHLALQMVKMCAQTIEDANFLRYFRDRWVLRLGSAWSMVDVVGEIMIALDADGFLVGANSGARRLLQPLSEDGTIIGRQIGAFFTDGAETLRCVARHGFSADPVALSTVGGALYYGTVLPPRCAPRRVSPATVVAPVTVAPALARLAGDDAHMERLIRQATRLASRQVNILIQGETGTGKEVLAKALHASGTRAKMPFIAVNCAAIPESLIESELFGYASGAFTGGRSKGMRGLIQQADGGTLFLDEIGDMPIHLQTRLLRVLAECEVVPLGADRPIPVKLTVIAASHRDLRKLIAAGSFREDLYYRLCGAVLHLPALRERRDGDYLIDQLLDAEGAEMGLVPRLAPAARAILLGYDWPGNIRQLRNVLRLALAISDGEQIDAEDLPEELMDSGGRIDASRRLRADPPNSAGRADADALYSALRRHRWNVSATASALGICRATVYRQMKRLGIKSPKDGEFPPPEGASRR